jgi:hypothetical protein
MARQCRAMAKTNKSRAAKAASRGKTPAKAAKKPARKAAKAKAPAAKAAKPAKSAKPAARPKPRKEVVEPSAMPEHAASKAAARRAVARPTKAHHEAQDAQMEKAEHDHQDPRLSGVGGTHAESKKVQAFNYGQFKNKAVGRLDKPINWFRRAPKQKQ